MTVMTYRVSVISLAIASLFVSPMCAQKASSGSAYHSSASNVYQQEDGFIDVNGLLLYYLALGRGEPLLILHGGPGASHDYFFPYLLPLALHNRLILIDERGSGRSQKLQEPSGYTIENMVEDVEGVRRALNLGKIRLLGHSYGGALAQAYALKYQQNLPAPGQVPGR